MHVQAEQKTAEQLPMEHPYRPYWLQDSPEEV